MMMQPAWPLCSVNFQSMWKPIRPSQKMWSAQTSSGTASVSASCVLAKRSATYVHVCVMACASRMDTAAKHSMIFNSLDMSFRGQIVLFSEART